MYKRDPVTPFQLADNQRDGSPLPPSLLRESMKVDVHPFSVSDKVLKKNRVDESCKANMRTKWTGPYATVDVSAVG